MGGLEKLGPASRDIYEAEETYFCLPMLILTTIIKASFLWLSHMKKECLDVLTGNPHTELPDFWSKVSMPLWNHFAIISGADTAAVNNPRSNMAYLVGSFL